MSDAGTPGDLICTAPFPSMPVAFWNDSSENTAYRAAYFNKFDGVWAHGDFLLINPKTKGKIIGLKEVAIQDIFTHL